MKRGRNGGWRIKYLFLRPTTVPEIFREWVENRVQLATEEVAARLADQSERQIGALLNALSESNEKRIQIATDQAMSHAGQGISAIAASLRGVAKALTMFRRQVELASFAKKDDMVATAIAVETEFVKIRSALDKRIGDHDSLSSDVVLLNKQIDSVATDVRSVIAELSSLVKKEDTAAAAATIETELAKIRSALDKEIENHDSLSSDVALLNKQIKSVAVDVGSAIAELSSLAKQEDMAAAAATIEAEVAKIRSALDKEIENKEILSGSVGFLNNQVEFVAAEIGSAISDYNAQLRSVENRVEFVRQETMYELQASIVRVAGTGTDKGGQITGRIINAEKVDRMRASGIRLNIGCGYIQHDDYVNIDTRELPGVDIIAEATRVPFEDGEVTEIASAHLVEHFTLHILDRVLLPYWKTLLKSGGQLTTVAPDGGAMLSAVNSGTMSFDDFREVLFGGQDYNGDFHYNLITPESYREALQRAGFVDIEEVYSEKRNGKCFEFKIVARKP